MKKILYSLVLVAVSAHFTNAQNPPQRVNLIETSSASSTSTPTVEGPEIQFEKMVHDYGQLVQGVNVEAEFKFKNIGSEPLILFTIQTSCGCVTAPSWPREPIMPGQEGVIKVNYNTNTSALGPIGSVVTVQSNAKTARVALRLTGNVSAR